MTLPEAREQGLTLTYVAHGTEPGDFRLARRVWAGWGYKDVQWVHQYAQERLAEARAHGDVDGWYRVSSSRSTAFFGAGGEVAHLVLEAVLAGGATGVAGAVVTEIFNSIRERLQHSPEAAHDPPIDWSGVENVEERIKDQLADVADLDASQLELVERQHDETAVLRAVYRDAATGRRYRVETTRHEAVFLADDDFPKSPA